MDTNSFLKDLAKDAKTIFGVDVPVVLLPTLQDFEAAWDVIYQNNILYTEVDDTTLLVKHDSDTFMLTFDFNSMGSSGAFVVSKPYEQVDKFTVSLSDVTNQEVLETQPEQEQPIAEPAPIEEAAPVAEEQVPPTTEPTA